MLACPFAVEKAKVGYRVIGVEQNPRRAAKINRGENYIGDVSTEDLQVLVAKGMLKAVEDFSLVPQMDVIVICVPTPLTKTLHQTCNMSKKSLQKSVLVSGPAS